MSVTGQLFVEEDEQSIRYNTKNGIAGSCGGSTFLCFGGLPH